VAAVQQQAWRFCQQQQRHPGGMARTANQIQEVKHSHPLVRAPCLPFVEFQTMKPKRSTLKGFIVCTATHVLSH
jgi:hypothetical protein